LPVVAMFVNESGRNEHLYRGLSIIHAFYQISVHLGKRFQRRFFQKSTNQKKEWHVAALFVNGLELNEQFLYTAFQGCFLPSFDSFVQAVSEKKIFLEINQSETRMGPLFVNESGQNEQSL
jgi:hypothetical protein